MNHLGRASINYLLIFRTFILTLCLHLPYSPILEASTGKVDLDALSIQELTNFLENKGEDKILSTIRGKIFYFEFFSDHEKNALKYQNLQQILANLFPCEYHRPVIDIKFFYNSTNKITTSQSIGILGGTGQLSDANIIRLIAKKLSEVSFQNSTMVHLLSLPPPRKLWDFLTGGLTYLYRLRSFGIKKYHSYYIASNTAHLNYNNFRFLSGYNRVFHLPNKVAKTIKDSYKEKEISSPVLILGTKQAWNGGLYRKILGKRGVPFVRLDRSSMLDMQNWIDLVKKRTLLVHEKKALKRFIQKISLLFLTPSILLGCTEIPLGLGDFKTELEKDGLTIFDSEHILVDTIVKTILHLNPKQQRT